MEVVKDKSEPKEIYRPKIIVAHKKSDFTEVKLAVIALYGVKALGMRICSLKEAIDKKLPLRAAQKDKQHPINFYEGVADFIPKNYKDPDIKIQLSSVTFDSDKLNRNDPCNCGSGKKYKKCCMNKKKN